MIGSKKSWTRRDPYQDGKWGGAWLFRVVGRISTAQWITPLKQQGMVDKHRVRRTRALSLSGYPLIREFLGELAGTFLLVVFKQNVDHHL